MLDLVFRSIQFFQSYHDTVSVVARCNKVFEVKVSHNRNDSCLISQVIATAHCVGARPVFK